MPELPAYLKEGCMDDSLSLGPLCCGAQPAQPVQPYIVVCAKLQKDDGKRGLWVDRVPGEWEATCQDMFASGSWNSEVNCER